MLKKELPQNKEHPFLSFLPSPPAARERIEDHPFFYGLFKPLRSAEKNSQQKQLRLTPSQ